MTASPVPAGPQHVDAIHALRRSLEDRMAAAGVVQWPQGSMPRERVEAQVADGQWWVVPDPEIEVAGTVRLLWSDPEYWGDDPTPAAYVHGLMVDRRRAGSGLGGDLLAWAAARGRDAGATLLRLDCRESNPALRRYYEGQGFRAVGRRDLGSHANTLLERPVGARRSTDR
ncbi:GNAT family N-acetyltransferase [Cellulomonas fimi]|uniref:GCN5-related N-acetyltransferase n=1 Tax=Cellulomonas fimi (strain ATCC 484 / DSM 20113 / JCM 1341 / CCUG 24087 / LMG 16345 / NBRC 15513 / NCIMB 8980 / NCTC 7547 / NRS-133) TaxID=590998 RepID=F4GZZ9_CELFA|nr:GNAT family N-acetyltransferase [Cellulomonas fimi]AEE44921.1 GCN5-related N-acetyltransferase [Cellulomonas fimi ATCC 484]NNH07256.1 GNAT family N-acetyltransferase [Cellulomonas fimi]VEH27686.1 Acetyltransferase (GNAT) family [Cellulomonas fimi]